MSDKKIAIYIRLSEEDGDLEKSNRSESNSITHQRMQINEFVKSKEELRLCETIEFCDDGYTGTNFERPGFQEMMLQMKKGLIGCIIVKDLSRFGREYLDVGAYLELILPIFNVRFISLNDNFDTNDYIGTTGGIELAFRNLINSMYSKDISIKIKTARKVRERRGDYLGGYSFYGYLKDPEDRHHLIVDEETRPVIERIFQMSADGVSTRNIARTLNEEGILCPVELKRVRGIRYSKQIKEGKALWLQATVRKIIQDERYKGHMVSNVRSCTQVGKNILVNNERSQWIIVENTHEAIISEELFNQANLAMLKRLKTVNRNTNWKNSGNLFVCGYCDRRLQKSKGKIVYLSCPKAGYMREVYDCSSIRENLECMEKNVIQILKVMGSTVVNISLLYEKRAQEEMEQAEKERRNQEKFYLTWKTERISMYEKYRDGEITKKQFLEFQRSRQEESAKFEKQIEEQKNKIKEIKQRRESLQQVKTELKSTSELSKYDPGIVSQIVEKILVYKEGRIELVMKSQDAYQQVMAIKEEFC